MGTAADRARQMAEDDPLCTALAPYYAAHAAEEAAHPDWHLNDLEAAGVSRETVLETMPIRDLASMMGARYAWIHHFHPVMLLGSTAILKGNPSTM